MLIKWVAVRVGDLAEFRRGQLAWAEVGRCEGFVGQLGGWSRRDDAVAHIVGGWASEPSYHAFMADAHDRIAAAQVGTYHGIDVRLFDRPLKIGAGLFAAAGDAALLRLAHCHVPAHRRAHFVQAQIEVWNPGMRAAPGMLGGVFAERGETEFLVLTRWRTVADHDRYLDIDFMDLRTRSHAAADLDAIAGDLIDLEPSWTVP